MSSGELVKRLVRFNLFSSAFCMMVQMSINTAMSYIFSESISTFTLFTGLYLMAMGLGVIIVDRLVLTAERLVAIVRANSLFVLVVAVPGIPLLLLTNEALRSWERTGGPDPAYINYPLGIALSVVLGIISGMEMPLLSKFTGEDIENKGDTGALTGALVSDYLGAFGGILCYAILLYPWLGLIGSLLVAVALYGILILAFLGRLGGKRPVFLTLAVTAALTMALGLALRQEQFLSLLMNFQAS